MAEGRERFRRFLARAADGGRCTEMGPLISAYADGEAADGEATAVHEHLRACSHCRATLRAYRAAPKAAAALAPILPLHRSLADRAHDAFTGLGARFGGGGGDSALSGVAATGGTRGAGMAALAKVLAICAGTVGGAAACVAGGVVPAPLGIDAAAPPHHVKPATIPKPVRHLIDDSDPGGARGPVYEPEATPPSVETQPSEPAPEPKPEHHQKPSAQEAEAPPPVEATPPPETEAGAVEFTPPPEESAAVSEAPAASPATSSSSSGSSSGSAAGEFGP